MILIIYMEANNDSEERSILKNNGLSLIKNKKEMNAIKKKKSLEQAGMNSLEKIALEKKEKEVKALKFENEDKARLIKELQAKIEKYENQHVKNKILKPCEKSEIEQIKNIESNKNPQITSIDRITNKEDHEINEIQKDNISLQEKIRVLNADLNQKERENDELVSDIIKLKLQNFDYEVIFI